jgi:hypothetical protein
MTIYNPEGIYQRYTTDDRHWCPRSESYTGADSLITAQRNGWQMIGLAYQQQILLRGGRYTTLYYFELERAGEHVLMPIVNNPFVTRMLRNYRMDVLPLKDAPIQILEEQMETMLA